jgi:hypothetical protein
VVIRYFGIRRDHLIAQVPGRVEVFQFVACLSANPKTG